MHPVFEAARKDKQRIVYAEGEDERVLRAVQTLLDEDLVQPTLIGRRDFIAKRVREMGLRLKPDDDLHILDPERDRHVFGALLDSLPAAGRPPRRAARCRGAAARAAVDRVAPPCCCSPARWTRRCAAAPAIGGGT